MATDPKARKLMISYEKGTATMTVGLFEYLFDQELKLVWAKPWDFTDAITGRKRMKYGRRQRSLAAGGREMFLRLDNGEVYSCRISGEDNDFIDYVLQKAIPGRIIGAWTKRGTKYGPQFPAAIATF